MGELEWEVLRRAALAGLIGYLVGLEREYIAHREAGSSTFGLITLAAATVSGIAVLVFGLDAGSRVVANIMVGVGFIGGGTILKERTRITGLTTAAGMWAMSAVGMVIGFGYYGLGILCTVLVVLLFSGEHLEHAVQRRWGRRTRS